MGKRSKWRVLVEMDSARDVPGVAQALCVAGLYDVEECAADLGIPTPEDYDLLIIVDVGDPRRALERLRCARRWRGDKPVIVLSNYTAAEFATACLGAGASDFVGIPFVGYELLQRIFTCLNAERLSPSPAYSRAPLPVNTAQTAPEGCLAIHLNHNDFTVTIGGVANGLTEVTFRVVEYLIQRAGTWVRSPEIQEKAIGSYARAGASNVRFHVHRARERFQFGGFAHYVHSWPRRGYMWSLQQCDTPHCQRSCELRDRSGIGQRSESATILQLKRLASSSERLPTLRSKEH